MSAVTGLQAFDALKKATKGKELGNDHAIDWETALDLRKLKTSDLVALGYDETEAERVSGALLKGDVGPLGESMGLKLSVIKPR
jgi:hypothetical protein